MSKTEVYSWRVAPDLKRKLEERAHAEKQSVSAVIESACRAWIEQSNDSTVQVDKFAPRRRALLKLFEAARASDQDASTPEPATNANIRKAFAAKLSADRKKWDRSAG